MKNVMTSRERMLTALRLEEPDRIPIAPRGVDPYNVESWSDPSYHPLLEYAKKHFDIWHRWHPEIDESAFLSASKKAKSRKDIYIERNYEFQRNIIETPKGTLYEVHKRRIDQIEKSYRCVKPFIEDDKDLEKFLSIPYEPVKVDIAPFFKEKQKLKEAGVLITGVPEPLYCVVSLFSYEDFVKRIIMERDRIIELMDIMFERCFDYAAQILEAGAKDVFEIVGPEFVAPPMFEPSYFEDFVVKYDSKIIKLIHEYEGIVYLHCHGKVNAVLEMFVDMSVDGLHPIEPPPMGDTPLNEAKRRIGDDVCLIGNIQISDIIYGSKEEVDKAVRQAIFEGGPDGLILCTSASPSWSPLPQKAILNYIQLAETALRYGRLSIISEQKNINIVS